MLPSSSSTSRPHSRVCRGASLHASMRAAGFPEFAMRVIEAFYLCTTGHLVLHGGLLGAVPIWTASLCPSRPGRGCLVADRSSGAAEPRLALPSLVVG